MTDAEVELLLYRIFSGKLYFFYKNEKYELRSPTIDIRHEAQLLYYNTINEEKYNDWLREDNLEKILITLGLWTMDTTTILKSLHKKNDDLKVSLFNQRALKDKTKENRKNLNNCNDQINSILRKKHEMFSHTLEGYASSIKNEYIVCNTLYKNDKKVFNTDLYNDQNSYTLFNTIISEINNYMIDTATFKALARSNIWRTYWNCNKQNIFANSVSDWTFDQRTLVSISRMYDNVYEHPDCPEDDVINDDDMLDGWMINEKRKIEGKKKQQKMDNLNPKLQKAGEVFLMANTKEEQEEIMALNSDESRNRLKQRAAYLNQNNTATDFQLPDVQMDLKSRSIEMARQQRRK